MECPGCQVPISETALACHACRRLVHAVQLDELAKRATALGQSAERAAERDIWEQCIALLPPDTVQRRTIEARIAEINFAIQAEVLHAEKTKPGIAWRKGAWGIGPILLLLLTKGKVLLLGLTNLGTLLSMTASIGVYWTMFGWAFALGSIVSIYIHEMGHVVALRKYGVAASAPMFVPGLGAFV